MWCAGSVVVAEGGGRTYLPHCLGDPMDREVWQATVYGVAKDSDTMEHSA